MAPPEPVPELGQEPGLVQVQEEVARQRLTPRLTRVALPVRRALIRTTSTSSWGLWSTVAPVMQGTTTGECVLRVPRVCFLAWWLTCTCYSFIRERDPSYDGTGEDKRRWFEFNDALVREFDPASVRHRWWWWWW